MTATTPAAKSAKRRFQLPSRPIVEGRSVSKIYDGGIETLSDITLDIPKGRLTALLGPSGRGKTTLLRLERKVEYYAASRN